MKKPNLPEGYISSEAVEQHIAEMWDAIENIPRSAKDRDKAIESAANTENELRDMLKAKEVIEAAAPDLAEALNDIVEQFKKVAPLYSKDEDIINKAITALKKAGYTE